jgi:hypothetical protein
MKKHLAYGVLLATVPSISLSYSSLTLKAKGNQPINTQPRATTHAVLPSIETIPGKTPHPFIRFLKRYKGRLVVLLGLL